MKEMCSEKHDGQWARRTFLTVLAGGAVSAVVAPSEAPPATAAPAVVKRLPELAVGIDSDPLTLDTRLTSPTQAYPIVQHFNEPLTFRETNGKVIPWLAESWERQGNLVWRLKLRKNVKFTNGEPFDAESAKYSLDCVVTPALFPKTTGQKRNWLRMVEKVNIVDANTIAITTKYPSRSMLAYLSVFGMLPPRHAKDLGEKYGANPVGTGPYRVVEYVPGNRLAMDANKSYWGGVPANEKLTIRILPEGATRVAALEAGEVGMINNLPPDQAERIKSNPKLDTIEVMSTRIAMWPMTANRPPFNDVRVRRAVNYGLDKEGIVKAMLGGHGMVAKSVYAPSLLYFKEQPAYEFDLEKAKKLLAEAGAVGAKINYGYPSGRYLNDKQIGQVVAQQLENLGFVVNAETGEWGGLFQKMLNSHFDIWLAAYGTLTLDPDWALGWLYLSKDSWSKYNNPRVDELIQNGDRAFDPKIAEGTYQELQSIIWQDAANAWGYYQPELHGVSRKLRNHKPRPDEYWLFKDVYLEQ